MTRKKGLYWHCHHDILLEYCYDYNERVAFIKTHKLKNERKTRLELFKKVRGKLPDEVNKARVAYDKALAAYKKAWAAYKKTLAACDKARVAYDKALAACDKARAILDKAIKRHSTEIKALHDKECPNCPWRNGTIFPHGA